MSSLGEGWDIQPLYMRQFSLLTLFFARGGVSSVSVLRTVLQREACGPAKAAPGLGSRECGFQSFFGQ